MRVDLVSVPKFTQQNLGGEIRGDVVKFRLFSQAKNMMLFLFSGNKGQSANYLVTAFCF